MSEEKHGAKTEEKKFKERYLAGEIEFEEIDRYITSWGFSDTVETLREYLGLSVDEETAWVEDSDEALEEMLLAQRDGGGAQPAREEAKS